MDKKHNLKRRSISLTDPEWESLSDYAKNSGITASQLIRMLIKRFLETKPKDLFSLLDPTQKPRK